MSTLIVIAKAPVPGRVKTRLCPPFTFEQAATLAAAALDDTLAAAVATSTDSRLLFLDGEPSAALLHAARGGGFVCHPQPSGGLDVRIAAAFAEAARLDPGPALLIGMDTPQVRASVLDDALDAMVRGAGAERPGYDAVFGPAEDGGFWALGLREPAHPHTSGLLLGVPMSRADTGAHQLRRLERAGLSVLRLPVLRDVDTAECAEAVAEQCPGSSFARELASLNAWARSA